MKTWRSTAALAALAIVAAACGSSQAAPAASSARAEAPADEAAPQAGGGEPHSGQIAIDGSSTVGPLTLAIAEEYAAAQPGVTVDVQVSGTGGGFERFCVGETAISNASRPITDAETQVCADNGIEYIEVRVGTDALTMVVNPSVDFVECLTTEQAAAIWGAPGATSWHEVDPAFPDVPLQVFAPGTDSGTYDFFTETILGEDGQVRGNYTASEDDNILVQGITGTPGSWGYFGFAYFQQNDQGLKALAYDAGDGCVEPSVEAVVNDEYWLARPLFIYVNTSALQQPHVADFVTFYLDNDTQTLAGCPGPGPATAGSGTDRCEGRTRSREF